MIHKRLNLNLKQTIPRPASGCSPSGWPSIAGTARQRLGLLPMGTLKQAQRGMGTDTDIRWWRNVVLSRKIATASRLDGYDSTKDVLRPVDVQGYDHDEGRWSAVFNSASHAPLPPPSPSSSLRVITWNVDFMRPDATGRVSAILDHLRDVVLPSSSEHMHTATPPVPTGILLQELNAESFAAILANDWVRTHFAITPPTRAAWRSHYGIATLISRDAAVVGAHELYFHRTTMGRSALMVDVLMRASPDIVPATEPASDLRRVVRIANTHLESLPEGASARPLQLRAVADHLRHTEATAGGLVGGDMNMIGPADSDIHLLADLCDACADPGPEAYTWGFQPPSRYGHKRLDRIFYVEDRGLIVEPVKVIGKGLKTKRGAWASDHYGLMTFVRLAKPVKHE